MWLRALVPENDLGAVRIGDALEVMVSALSDRMYRARVMVIGALSDVTTYRVVVRSEIANPDGALKSEMFASIRIELEKGISLRPSPLKPSSEKETWTWSGSRRSRLSSSAGR